MIPRARAAAITTVDGAPDSSSGRSKPTFASYACWISSDEASDSAPSAPILLAQIEDDDQGEDCDDDDQGEDNDDQFIATHPIQLAQIEDDDQGEDGDDDDEGEDNDDQFA